MRKDFDLTRYLPYLVNRAGVRLAGAFGAELRPHGISLQMWRVLAALHHADRQRVSDLAGLTSIDVSTLSRVLDAMQKKGLVKRERGDNGDARVVTVALTPRGHALTEALIPRAREYEAIALDGFSPAEAATLKAMLARVYGNLAALADADPAREGEAA